MRIAALLVGGGIVISLASLWAYFRPEYHSTLICGDDLHNVWIVGEHVYITGGPVYRLERSDKRAITYEKTAFERCSIVDDKDVIKSQREP